MLVFFSMNYRYLRASLGKSSFLLTFEVSFCHPFRVQYTTSTFLNSVRDAGTECIDFPLSLYYTATFISGKESKISSFVIFIESYPLTMFVYLIRLRSSQPHLLGLPVVVPNQWPFFLISFPISSKSSVGNGPSPTLVVYAFTTPITVSIFLGYIPRPVDRPPIEVEDEVTYG